MTNYKFNGIFYWDDEEIEDSPRSKEKKVFVTDDELDDYTSDEDEQYYK